MRILGIETSCDETAAAVVEGNGDNIKVLSNVVASQIKIHEKYGGVVPEVAAREHVLHILPVINEALDKSGLDRKDAVYRAPGIDTIAVTQGPGLITSLMVGVETAKALSYAWDIPLAGVNHIEGHIYANFVGRKEAADGRRQNIRFPALVLTVSGGHTSLVVMHDHGKYEVIGETRDDAAGEAFDKAAQLLGLGYPGGPAISKAATIYDPRKTNNEIAFPRPMLNKDNFEFSFSGLKTSILYQLKKDKYWKQRIPEYAFAFEEAVVDVLITKTLKAAKKYKVKTVMLSGGVAANTKLREQMAGCLKNDLPDINYKLCDRRYATDNAVMIATAGYYYALKKQFTPWNELSVDCNFKIGQKNSAV